MEEETGSSKERQQSTKQGGGGVSLYAWVFSVLFVMFAMVLPLDQASQVMTPVVVTVDNEIPSSPTYSVEESRTTSEEKRASKRGKFLGMTYHAKDLYEAYKEIESEYHTKAFQKATQWKVLASRDDVEVSLMEHENDPNCPYIKMVAIIPASVQDCWKWLSLDQWPKNMPKMDPFYEGFEIRGDYNHRGVNMILARKRTKRILAFGKRDMVFLSVSDKPLPDGTWVSGSVSVQTPKIPRRKGYTRAFQDSIAFYKPLEGNTKTKLTIVCRIDLNDSSEDGSGGWIPMWIYVKTVGAAGLRSVTSMRDIIAEEYRTRMESEGIHHPSSSSSTTRISNEIISGKWMKWNGGGGGGDDRKSTLSDLTSQPTARRFRFRLPWVNQNKANPSSPPVISSHPRHHEEEENRRQGILRFFGMQ